MLGAAAGAIIVEQPRTIWDGEGAREPETISEDDAFQASEALAYLAAKVAAREDA